MPKHFADDTGSAEGDETSKCHSRDGGNLGLSREDSSGLEKKPLISDGHSASELPPKNLDTRLRGYDMPRDCGKEEDSSCGEKNSLAANPIMNSECQHTLENELNSEVFDENATESFGSRSWAMGSPTRQNRSSGGKPIRSTSNPLGNLLL
jgi:hypothetical protein